MLKYYKIYGLYGLIRLFRDKIFTYLYFPKARLIRLPFYIRSKKGIIGAKSLTTGVNLRIDIISRNNLHQYYILVTMYNLMIMYI